MQTVQYYLLPKVSFMIHSIGRDFDEGILPRISEVRYEDEMDGIPSAPDVSNYLISEVYFHKGNCFRLAT